MAEPGDLMGSGSWIQPNPGPLARAAVEAIGVPWNEVELRIEMSGYRTGNQLSVNGCRVPRRDATLVRDASACDPVRIGPEPDPWTVAFIKRALVIRRLLNLGGETA